VLHPTIHPGGRHELWDIEDLVKLGNEHHACPFFTAKKMCKKAQIVFCPYQYLMDPIILKHLPVPLEGSVVLIDEAHNIEDVSREVVSMDLLLSDIDTAYTELSKLPPDYKEYFSPLIPVLECIIQWMKNPIQNEVAPNDFEQSVRQWSGDYLVGLLVKCGISEDNIQKQIKEIDKGCGKIEESGILYLSIETMKNIERLWFIFGLLMEDNMVYMNDYRVVIENSVVSQYDRSRREAIKEWVTKLGIWCLNPSVGFHLITKHTRSVILTSGTLSPFDSFQSELGTIFHHTVEANHIIDADRQLWVGSVSKSKEALPLRTTFQTVDSYQLQDTLGNIIIDYCRLIPQGILCFFSSYIMLDKIVQRWHDTGTYKLLQDIKHIIQEPRLSDKRFKKTLDDYQSHAQTPKGAIFLAVCRGKISEGLDFGDYNARGVLIIGLPFPNIKNLKITLKKQYNSLKSKESKDFLSGDAWYNLQAFRAVNQAVGRCIRHKEDYGSIVLIDERFSRPEAIASLSKWIRMNLKTCSFFEQSIEGLTGFFQSRELKKEEKIEQDWMEKETEPELWKDKNGD